MVDSSWNGTAPIDASSGDHTHHRLSRAGNRRINRTLHIMAVVQLRNGTEGRRYYRRKLAAGKNTTEAMRCLKRRLSDVVYRQMTRDATAAEAAREDTWGRLLTLARPTTIPASALGRSQFRTRHTRRYAPAAAPQNPLIDMERSHERTFVRHLARVRRTSRRLRQASQG